MASPTAGYKPAAFCLREISAVLTVPEDITVPVLPFVIDGHV